MISLPALPPTIDCLPADPSMKSLPVPPVIVSLAAPPIVSAPSPPIKVSPPLLLVSAIPKLPCSRVIELPLSITTPWYPAGMGKSAPLGSLVPLGVVTSSRLTVPDIAADRLALVPVVTPVSADSLTILSPNVKEAKPGSMSSTLAVISTTDVGKALLWSLSAKVVVEAVSGAPAAVGVNDRASSAPVTALTEPDNV